GLPLREVIHQHAVLAGEIALAEMHGDRLSGIAGAKPGKHGAQIARIAEVQFADALRRAHTHQLNILKEFLVRLHALFAFIARHAFRKSGNDREAEVLALRPIEQHAMRIHEDQLGAIAEKGNGRALGDLDAQVIWQDALHAGFLHPGELLNLRAALIQRNAQDAAVAVVDEKLENLLARHDVVAGNCDLVGLQQEHLRRVQRIAHRVNRGGYGKRADYQPKKDAAIERPGPAAEFLAANLHRLLAAQITRLFVRHQLRPVGFLVSRGCRGRVPLYGLQAFQTTTSFSRVTP